MSTISQSLKLLLNLNAVQGMIVKKFDSKLSNHGISLNEFMILYHLGEAQEEKLRRTDLAEKTGLTASGITRMLLPLEKMGLVKKEANSRDARVSYVKLSTAGKRILNDSIVTAELTTEQILAVTKSKKMDDFMQILHELGGAIQ